MKHILHYARKDLTRHWLLALLVVLVIALDALDVRFGLISVKQNGPPDSVLGSLIKWPLCFLLIVALVQEDRVVDSRAHWLTRPIAPAALLITKLLLVTAIIVLPYAFSILLLNLSLDASPTVAALAGFEGMCIALMLALITALVAGLTRTIIEAAMLVAAGLLSWLVIGVLLTAFPTFGMSPSNISGASRLALTFSLGVPMAAALLGFHYQRRSRALTATLTAVAGATLFSVCYSSPWQIVSPRQQIQPPASTVSSDFQPSHVTLTPVGGAYMGFDRTVRLRVRIASDRGDRILGNGRATTTLTLWDGTEKRFPPIPAGSDVGMSTRSLIAALRLPGASSGATLTASMATLSVPRSENLAVFDRPVKARTIVEYNEYVPREIARISAGQRVSFRSEFHYRAAYPEFMPNRNEVVIRLRKLVPTSILFPNGIKSYEAEQLDRLGFVLHHPRLNEFIVASPRSWSSDSGWGPVRITRSEFVFRGRRSADGKALGEPFAEWLAESELLVFRAERVGTSRQEFTIPAMTVTRTEETAYEQFW